MAQHARSMRGRRPARGGTTHSFPVRHLDEDFSFTGAVLGRPANGLSTPIVGSPGVTPSDSYKASSGTV